ncbi:MAG: LptF/LptG family permease, partial [Bacteroidetes bacterium]|nr:LptF/LptG family permease [Bacteroidota bacterium]
MKKLNLFILKSYLGPFVMTFFISLFILLMQFVWKYIDDLVGKGFEWHIIARLLFYASSTFVPLALPLAILLSSLMTFGNLGENYELVAMKSAGISLQKAMRPLIITAILISIGAYYFSNIVLPIANLKMGTLLYDVREQKPAVNIKEGVFYKEIDDFVIKVG